MSSRADEIQDMIETFDSFLQNHFYAIQARSGDEVIITYVCKCKVPEDNQPVFWGVVEARMTVQSIMAPKTVAKKLGGVG